jgi:hypothetical protein
LGGPEIARSRGTTVSVAALALLALALSIALRPGADPPQLQLEPASGSPDVERSYGQLPLAFMRDGGSYTASTAAGSIALRRGEATIVPTDGRRAGDPITIGLAGAAAVEPHVAQQLPGVVNDLRGDDPDRWRTGVPTFARIRYAGVYPGISMDYHGTSGTLEYDFRLDPGADPGRIALDFHGAPLHVTKAGALVAGGGADRLRQAPPVAFQPSADGRDPVPASFTLHGGRVGFELGAYDRARPLVIDPLVLSYATLLGGNDEDRVQDIAADSTGAAYVTGYTLSNDFPTKSAYDATRSGIDVIVSKLNPAGSDLVYSTLLGGSETDFGDSIAVDSSGSAFVTGETQSTDDATELFPVAGGAYAPGLDDSRRGDVFVAKLNPAGSGLVYSSVFGGGYAEEARAIAIDSSGDAYVGGYSSSYPGFTTSFPTTTGAYDETFNGDGSRDGFVTKLNANGSLGYSTLLGGAGQDEVNGIDVDSLGRAYVTGFASAASSGTDFPTTPGNRFAAVDANGTDAYLSRLSANGSSLDYSTGIGTDGGSGNDGADYGYAVAAGPTDGIAYITGGSRTGSGADFPLKHEYQGRPGGCCTALDTFVAKFDTSAAGNASLLYSTLLGGTSEDVGSSIDVDSAGNAYVGGTGASASGVPFPTTPDELGSGTNRGSAYVTKIVQSGSDSATLGFSTTIPGSSASDSLGGLQYDEANGAVYVGGTSRNGLLPTTQGAYQTAGNRSFERDGFALKISTSAGPPDTTPPNTAITSGPANGSTVASSSVTFGFTADEASTFQCRWDGGAFAPCASGGPGTSGNDTRTLPEGAHTFEVRATDAAMNVDATPDSRTFTVDLPNPPPPQDKTPPQTTITKPPPAKVKSKRLPVPVSISFASNEAGSTFTCRVDGGAAAACSSPATFKLGRGAHTIAVTARDKAGNVDASPAAAQVTVTKKKKKKKHHHHHHR